MVSYAVFSRAIRLGGIDILNPHWTLLWVCQSRDEAIDDCRRRTRDNDEDIVEYKYEETKFYVDYSVGQCITRNMQ